MKRLALAILVASLAFIPYVAIAQTLVPAPHPTLENPHYGRVSQNANLRAGPGTQYPIVGAVKRGDIVAATGCNSLESRDSCDWVVLQSGMWIAAFLIGEEVTVTPTVTPLPLSTATFRPTTVRTPSLTSTQQPVQVLSTLPPVTDEEVVYMQYGSLFASKMTDALNEFTRYINLASRNPSVMRTYTWKSGMADVLSDSVNHVTEMRQVKRPASNPQMVTAMDAYLDAVEAWAMNWEAYIWVQNPSDLILAREALTMMTEAFQSLKDVLVSQEERYAETPEATMVPPGLLQSTPAPTTTLRPTRTTTPTPTP